jgi:hypothetical protein
MRVPTAVHSASRDRVAALAQHGLELGEDLFDGIEVGAVGRQEGHSGADPLDGLSNGLALVRAEIVHDDDVARRQGRDQDLLYIGLEGQPIDGTVDDTGCGQRITAQGGEEGAGLPMAMRHGADRALTAWSTGMGANHVGLDPGLVDEDQALCDQRRLLLAPRAPRGGDVGAGLLGGMECLFLSVRPNAPR